MAQRSGQGYNPLSLLHIHSKTFKRSQRSRLCSHYPPSHKAYFARVPSVCAVSGAGDPHGSSLLEISWKQQPAAPTLPLITTTSLWGRRVFMQQKSTSLLVSYSKAKTKVGFVQLSRTAKACKEGSKKCGYFWFWFGPSTLKQGGHRNILIRKV